MHKPTGPFTCATHAGCDTSKDTVDVVRATIDGATAHRRFNNTAAGHGHLIQWLQKAGAPVRVVVEASGIYSTIGASSTWPWRFTTPSVSR